MNIIFSGGKWTVYTDQIETYDKLPAMDRCLELRKNPYLYAIMTIYGR